GGRGDPCHARLRFEERAVPAVSVAVGIDVDAERPRLPEGVAMFLGTMPAIGKIRSSQRFEMELEDPVLHRKITHAYRVQSLPIIS
ncbi:MAG: DUF2848 family protein, partial [Enhydrobacter sp.]